MAVDLTCRFYEALYPVQGSVVMAKVERIENRAAYATLLEYNNFEALILFANEDEVTVGRTSPFLVSEVTPGNEVIVLDYNPPSPAQIWDCGKRFLMARHVHRVLFSVAEELEQSLESVYARARWPSLEQLKNLHTEEWFLTDAAIDPLFRKFLLDRIKLMKYTSWRIINPSVLQICFLFQLASISWAVSLVRQLEAFMKLLSRLRRESYLSVQDLVNQAVRLDLLEPDGSIISLTDLALIIQEFGLVKESVCPLTNALDGGSNQYSGSLTKVDEMEVFERDNEVPDESMAYQISKELERGPITCLLLLFPSYKEDLNRDITYAPTAEEYAAYKQDENKGCNLDKHVMLCTGSGVDRYGKEFFEFQNSTGDINAVDFGFCRFAQNTVIQYVVLRDHREKKKRRNDLDLNFVTAVTESESDADRVEK